LIVRSLGVQSETRYFLGNVSRKWTPLSSIQDYVIKERIGFSGVTSYLALVVEKNEQTFLKPLFHHFLPRLRVIGGIYRDMLEILEVDRSEVEKKQG
jgi:hypothetical protein